MKNLLIFLLVLNIYTTSSFSQPVDIDDAKTVATNFYFERINQYETVKYHDIEIMESFSILYESITVYYAFNIKPAGYIIVSGTKNAVPVPAYSFKSSFSTENQPPQFVAWMKQYYDQICYAIEGNNPPTEVIVQEWKRLLFNKPENLIILKDEKEVLPMLISTWDQGVYYNQMCPEDPSGPDQHCVTGCVATAMGQLCYYFRWPETGTGSYTYEHPEYGTISANFEETHYKWEGMSNNLTFENQAVAELLFHLGVSVDMDYGPDGSGMWNHKAAYSLRTFFKYAPESEYLYRDSTNIDWDSTIIDHLDRKIPLYYAGWSNPWTSGHAFICDGYQTDEYFHFNWGWGGYLDGYFYLNELSPGGSNFNLAQELVINCYPDTINYSYPDYCEGGDTIYFLNGTFEDGSRPMYDYSNNSNCSWLITPQTIYDSVSHIIINYDKIDIELENDILTIYDGDSETSPVLGQYSGNTLPYADTSTSNKVFITFSSNGNNTAPGWFISYHSVQPIWCTGLTILSEPSATFEDGSGSFNYANSPSCVWEISPELASSITIEFLEFNTEEDKDEVQILNGSFQELAVYSGQYETGNLPEPYTVTGETMYLAFIRSATINKPGWTASYTINNVGIEHYNDILNNVNCSPNPAKNSLTIDLNLKESQEVILKFISLTGKEIFTDKFRSNVGLNQKTLSLNGIPKGIYLLRLESNKINHIEKIVVN